MAKQYFVLFATLLAFLSSHAHAARSTKIELPRLGLETETAIRNSDDQVISAPNTSDRTTQTKTVLEFWRQVFGGEVKKNSEGVWNLDPGSDRVGWFWVDSEWASDIRSPDGYEFVTPPLEPKEVNLLVANFDRFFEATHLGPGLKTSQQYNIELRDLIDGFSLKERPSQKMGVAYKDIENANIDRVVNLFLYLEINLIKIYAAYSPRRLGFLVNYFAMPFSFEIPELLQRLAEMPKSERTYRNVRNVFLEFKTQEEAVAQFGNRTEWKYRTFNIRKFFALNEPKPSWIYPALEVRIPDTPDSAAELKRQLSLTYALYVNGASSKISTTEIASTYAQYRKFWQSYKNRLSFEKAIRIVNQDMVSQSLTSKFRTEYSQFLNDLKLSLDEYPPFRGAEPSPFVSQTYGVFGLIGDKKDVSYAGRTVHAATLRIPWDLTGVSFGAECEFTQSPELLATLRQVPFLEPEVTVEKTGNREVITKPTTDLVSFLTQLQYQRDVLGDNLKGMHLNLRLSKEIYKRIPKQKFDAWIARIGDWISVIRANYRNPKFAFRTRTQNRMQVNTPNAWIGDDKAEYRGTVRVYSVGDQLNIEFRGLMDGIYKQVPLEPDLFTVVLLTFLKGINEPDLIEGDFSHRLLTEVQDPSVSLREVMSKFAEARGESLANSAHLPEELVSAVRVPNLMLLPLMGFEYLPLISGHDIRRMQHATTNWKHEVWSILQNRDLTKEGAQEKFIESLKKWSRESSLESALFDSLLVSPAQGLSWTDLHLPAQRARTAFLSKLLTLSGSEFDKPAFELFVMTWSQKDLKSLVDAAQTLQDEMRQRLGNIILSHDSTSRARAILKSLAIKPVTTGSRRGLSDSLQTNMNLLTQAPPEAFVAEPEDETPTEVMTTRPILSQTPRSEGNGTRSSNDIRTSTPSPQRIETAEARGWFRRYLDEVQSSAFMENYDFALGQLNVRQNVDFQRYLTLINDSERMLKNPDSEKSLLSLLPPFKGLFDNTDNIFLNYLPKYKTEAWISLKLKWLLTPPGKRIADFKMYFSEMKSPLTFRHYTVPFLLWVLPTLNESDRREMSLFANAAFTKTLVNDPDWKSSTLTQQLNTIAGEAIRFYDSTIVDAPTQTMLREILVNLPKNCSFEIFSLALHVVEAASVPKQTIRKIIETQLGAFLSDRRNSISSPYNEYNYKIARLVQKYTTPQWLATRTAEEQKLIELTMPSAVIPETLTARPKNILATIEMFESYILWKINPDSWSALLLQFIQQTTAQSASSDMSRISPAIDAALASKKNQMTKEQILDLLLRRWSLTHSMERMSFIEGIYSQITFSDLVNMYGEIQLNTTRSKWAYLEFFSEIYGELPAQKGERIADPIRRFILQLPIIEYTPATQNYLLKHLNLISSREQIFSLITENAAKTFAQPRSHNTDDIHRINSIVNLARLLGFEKEEVATLISPMMDKAANRYSQIGHLTYTDPLAEMADNIMPDSWFVDWVDRLNLLKKRGSMGRYQRLLNISSRGCQDILSHYR